MSVDETDEEPQLCYPDSGILDSSVPLAVRKNYIEAKSVQKKSPNAFALLVRRALEAICDDKGVASNKPLKQRLDSMAAQGIIPPTLAEVTGILRILGNAGAHNSPKDVTIPQTWRIEKLFRAIVEYVYIAPKMVADAKKSIAKPPEI
ncbi:MAG TPA: DUF4145 domain-containing protein [Lacunisphaera sp.]|nr:DUF4145 domain-containing protein [Lacunisphaera sp.]